MIVRKHLPSAQSRTPIRPRRDPRGPRKTGNFPRRRTQEVSFVCSTASCTSSLPDAPGTIFRQHTGPHRHYTDIISNSARKESTRRSPSAFSAPGTRIERRISCTVHPIPGRSLRKEGIGRPGGYNGVNGSNLSAPVDHNGLSPHVSFLPANAHDMSGTSAHFFQIGVKYLLMSKQFSDRTVDCYETNTA